MLILVTFVSAFLFIIGLAALFLKQSTLKYGAIITFTACILNFSAFSNFNALSVDGQVFAIAVMLVLVIHLVTQKNILKER